MDERPRGLRLLASAVSFLLAFFSFRILFYLLLHNRLEDDSNNRDDEDEEVNPMPLVRDIFLLQSSVFKSLLLASQRADMNWRNET